MEFGMPTAQPTILHGIHHTNPQKVLFFLIVKGNVDKTFQFATGVTSTDWFVTWNCLDYIIVGRSAAACVCSHCHISPLTNAVSKTSPCFLCFLFSLSLAFSSESVSKTCRIWCSFFFLSQVRNTCLSMCIYIMQLVLVLFVGAVTMFSPVSHSWLSHFCRSATFISRNWSGHTWFSVIWTHLNQKACIPLTFSSSVDRTRGDYHELLTT